jgi:DNA-binding transcriptional ArsR family regulator
MSGKLAHDVLEMVEYRENPAVHLFGDSEPALERMRRAAQAADCRIVSSVMIGADAEGFRRSVPNAAALIELDGALGPDALIPLLDWAQSEAEAGARRSVVSAPIDLLDLVAARAPHGDVAHLCEAGPLDRLAAVAGAARPVAARLHDVGRDDGSVILQQLSEDVGRIAAILASLSEEEAAAAAAVAARTGAGEEAAEAGVDAATIRAIIRARRLRDQYFRGDLFADPAWDMLLDLMAARLEKNRVAVSSLCIAAAVPATTALRWIKALTDRGLFVRAADPEDGRRVYIELSDEAARALSAYLRALQRTPPGAV